MSLLENADAEWVDSSTGVPLFWTAPTVSSGGSYDNTSTTGPEGFPVKPFRVVQTTPAVGATPAPLWFQTVYDITRDGPTPGFLHTVRLHPQRIIPAALNVSLWSKATGVVLGSGYIGACFVVYYYDANGNTLNPGGDTSGHFATLGPNGKVSYLAPSTIPGTGVGTWGWTYQSFRIPIHSRDKVAAMTVSIGLHQSEVIGDVSVWGLRIEPTTLNVI